MKALFTGHRYITSAWNREINHLINLALECNVNEFFVGMALGSDQVAAEILTKRKLNWTAVVPCGDQAELWKPRQRSHYKRLLSAANRTVTLYPTYSPGVMQARNLWMVKRSQICLAVWSGNDSGGTALTVSMAKEHNLTIIQFNPLIPTNSKYRFFLHQPMYQQLSLF
ncbi:SLOG family protein [Kamptonema animale CS-326]|jgi:uncharacterized phage-like protein YoqJ|uniref:SLOG family protein n=1 Tax=Kamptonema animale TaxID=92934 RepID=UPI00233014A6|nr:SLOG family protein [Kamptonema animale]MDB9513909.1 SLOG family protein [Kamptonema animale CS-326]